MLSPPVRKGRHSFEAVEPVNVIVPLNVLTATFQNLFICPTVGCESKKIVGDSIQIKKSLQLETTQYGLATEIDKVLF
jgi:hypothetical protein